MVDREFVREPAGDRRVIGSRAGVSLGGEALAQGE
jgi:hypothetical protein